MIRLFTPLILVIAAFGLFYVYTNPIYQNIKQLKVQNASYDDALTKAQQLHQVRDQLLAKRNAFLPTDIDKLMHILPENLDTIRLIIDINNIAVRHTLSLANVDLGSNQAPVVAPTEGVQNPVGFSEVGFSVNATNYEDFLGFIQDIEHSIRLVDISKIQFTTGTTGITTYAMSVRSYWLH